MPETALFSLIHSKNLPVLGYLPPAPVCPSGRLDEGIKGGRATTGIF